MSRSELFELSEQVERQKQKLKVLRSLLREAAGPMSYGHWPSDFRAEVKRALRYDRGVK